MNTTNNGYTPTQQRMLAVLADEKPHNRFELQKCLRDEMTSVDTVKVHIATLRKRLRLEKYDISCELLSGESYYRLVRTAHPVVE